MFGLLSGCNKNIVGIDIGSSAVRLVEITETSGGYQLSRIAQVPLARGVIEKGLMNDGAAVTKAIKELIKVSKCSTKNAATALSGFSVLINKGTFRDMEEDEIRQVVMDEAGEYMPIDTVENVYFDIHVLGPNENNAEKLDVIIAAAKKDIIAEYRSAVESAGLRVVVMDADSFALETAYEANYEFSDDDVVALVNIGASLTNINIVRGAQSVFTRNVLMGGDLITEAIQKQKGVSFEEAEEFKQRRQETGGDVMAAESQTEESLVGLAEPIMAEIERSIDFFISSMGLVFIKKVLLSGGCARIPGIMEDLSQRLRCDVEPFDPFKSISYDKKVHEPALMSEMAFVAPIAVGLALRKMDD